MPRTTRRRTLGLATLAATSFTLALVARPASATSLLKPVTGLASVATNGSTGNAQSHEPSLSTGGRFVAFASSATNLVAGGSNGQSQIYVRDTLADTTTLVSVTATGQPGNGASDKPAITPDGRSVAFQSTATDLVAGDGNGKRDIFVRDLVSRITLRASLTAASTQITGDSELPSISSDGKTVTFESWANGIVASDQNDAPDIYVRSLASSTTTRASVTSAEVGLVPGATDPAMSADGRYVVFDSTSKQFGDLTGTPDVYLRDTKLGTTELISITYNLHETTFESYDPTVSDDGRYVAFVSRAKILSGSDTTNQHIYRRDRTTGTTIEIDAVGATPANSTSSAPVISASGAKVAFSTDASNLTIGDINTTDDVFVATPASGTIAIMSTTTGGAPLDDHTIEPDLSPDGTVAAFSSLATNAYAPDANGEFDVFWRGTYQVGPWSDSIGLLEQSGEDFTGVTQTLGMVVPVNNRILQGTENPGTAIVDWAHGTFDDDRGPVIRLYWAFFKRLPDQAGLDHWVNKHHGGTSLKAIATEFAKSSEFKLHYGSVSDTAFITLVYQNVLERDPDPTGLAHWVAKLGTGTSRGEMMINFSESSEGIRRMRGETDTILLYEGLVRRLPTVAEFMSGVSKLEAGVGRPSQALALTIITSNAYALRFG